MPKVRDKGLKRKSDRNSDEVMKSKRITPLLLSKRLESQSILDSVCESWLSNKPLTSDAGIILSTEPFKHCIVQDFVAEKEDLWELKEELLTMTLNEKLNDLYQFSQSQDLSTVNKPMVNALEEFLQNKCRPWLEKVTGIKLNEKISATCSSYKHTDHLLCHDDKCEDRIIAFILYLTENWTSECGGALDLFDTDASGYPKEVVKSILPAFNSFVFFEVADNSFHQVAEVTSQVNNRLSVNGWFHGTHSNVSLKEAVSSLTGKVEMSYIIPQDEGEQYLRHINPMYLDSDIQEQIREEFEESSEILLPKFLQENIFKELCESFYNKDITWNILGPPNIRKYEIATEVSLPAPVRNMEQLFQSKCFFSLLKSLTNLDLAPTSEGKCKNDSSSNPYCLREVQRWQKGFYTLIHDNTCSEFALDVTLYCNVKSNKLVGGYTSYIARDADEELLTVEPQDNALALTFKDKDTLRFVKYISTCNPDEVSYHAMHYIYKESTQESTEKAAEELLLEAKRAAARASVGGALAWQKCPLPPTNKNFLHNTVCSVLITNKLKEKRRQETMYKHKAENKKTSRSPKRNEMDHVPKCLKSESKTLKNMKQFKHKHAEKIKKYKGEFKQSKNIHTTNKKKHNR